MGGNRVSKARWFFNIAVVWFLTGFWHGASWNFIIWGLYFAIFLIIEKLVLLPILQKAHIWNHIYVLLVVLISFVIFNAADMTEAIVYLKGMFGMGQISLLSAETIYYAQSNTVALLLAAIGAAPIGTKLVKRLEQKKKIKTCIDVCEPLVWIVLLLLCTAYLVDGSFNPFLYFRF